jgi:hypothetical protein
MFSSLSSADSEITISLGGSTVLSHTISVGASS